MTRRLVFAGIVLCAVALRAEPPRRVAVYDLRTNDVSERTAAIVTDGLVGELRKLERLSVLGMVELRALVTHEMNRQLAGCDEDDGCVAEIAGALGVDEIVVGSLGRVGDSHVLSVKRLDVRKARVERASTRRVPVVDGQEFLSLVGPVVEQLYPDHAPRPGLLRGVNPELVNLLKPPPLPRWVFFGTGAVGVALAGTGGGLFFSASRTAGEVERLEAAGVDAALTVPLRDETQALSTRANWFLLSAAVTLAAAGVEALFTDWYGYRDWKPGTPAEVR